MDGPNEFTIIGTIRDWDVTAQLPKIRLPTLVTVGRYDEVTPHVAEAIHRGIRGSRLVRLEKSAHLARWEERAKYIGVVRDFLDGGRPHGLPRGIWGRRAARFMPLSRGRRLRRHPA